MARLRHKFVFHTMPSIPRDRLVPIVDGLKWRIVSRTRLNSHGEPACVGLLVYQPSRNIYRVLCFDKECTAMMSAVSKT